MFPYAMIVSQRAVADQVRSALPHAPTMPAVPLLRMPRTTPAHRFRTALAGALHRTAAAVSPAGC